MGENPKNALVHVDVTGEAANTLVKKIARFVWGVFGPTQIKRFAKAEAEAARIAAESEIEITDLHRRAMQRRLIEDAAQQASMEAIVGKAVPLLEEGANADAVDDDWLANFFEKCRNVSNEEMQSLWARVLAGEVNAPESFSRRTVNSIADLDRRDCEMFTQLCSFAWNVGGPAPLIFDREAPIYETNGITFALLSHLESIGLVHYSNEPTYHLEPDSAEFDVEYFGTAWTVKMHGLAVDREELLHDPPLKLVVGQVLLTKLGEELAPIAGGAPVSGFADYVANEWREMGHALALADDRDGDSP